MNKWCLVLACAWGASAASAMDLSQVYEAALSQDAATNAARATAQAGRENLPQARAQLMPSVSASFSRNRNQLDSVTPNSLGQLADASSTYPSSNNTLSVRQPIYRRYQWAQYRQTQAQVDDVDAVLESELQNLSIKVAGAYLEALMAQDQLALIRTQMATYRTQLDAAKKMYAAGSGTRTDADEVQSRLDMSVAQELEARQNVDYTRGQLRVLVNQPVETLAAMDASKLALLPPNPVRFEDWVEKAEQASPELRVLRARVEAANFEVDKASAGHYPTLDAVAQWSRSSSENNLSIDSTYETRTIGLQLNVPIFSGGSVNAAVRQALANKNKAEQLLEAGRRDLGMRVYKEFRGVSEGVLKVQALEQAVRSAEQTLLSSQKSFQAGNRTRLDILNAENARMVALRDLAQARYIYLISGLRLKALTGEADRASVDALNACFTE
ncbi:MAG: TolC family outer membrane protein [Burkholderiales bacterium]